MPRVYERKFDWDEARRLRSEGLSYSEIGRRLGVTDMAVRRVLDPAYRAKDRARSGAWQRSGNCPDCGAQTTRRSTDSSLRCVECATRLRATTVDDERGLVRCMGKCGQWLPPEKFASARRGPNYCGRPYASECRDCNTARKREWREANREKLRAYDRDRKARERQTAKVAA